MFCLCYCLNLNILQQKIKTNNQQYIFEKRIYNNSFCVILIKRKKTFNEKLHIFD